MQTDKPAGVLGFGRHIERMRKERGLSLEQFAERAGLAVGAIREIEGGGQSPSLDAVRRIWRGLNLRLFELFESFERQEDGS